MKKTEIATIIFVASLSMMATYFIANAIIGEDSTLSTTVKTADRLPANPGDVELSKQFFHDKALNPTVEVYVESDNQSTNTADNALSSSKPGDADSNQSTTQPNQDDATIENEQQ